MRHFIGEVDTVPDEMRSELLEQWIYWRNGYTPDNITVDERVRLEAETVIGKLLESEYLSGRFTEYPLYFRYLIFRQLKDEANIREIESFAALWKRTTRKFPEISWTSSLINQVIRLEDGPSTKFNKVAEVFSRKYVSSGRRASDGNVPTGGIQTPAALFLLYGEEVLIEVMKRTNDQDEHISTSMLIELVDRWEELKEYPIQWALKMLDYSFLNKWSHEE